MKRQSPLVCFLPIVMVWILMGGCLRGAYPTEKLYSDAGVRRAQKSDDKLTDTAYNLLQNLATTAESGHFLFGQEFPTEFLWNKSLYNSDTNLSDCKNLIGAQPALFGSDFLFYGGDKSPDEITTHEAAVLGAFRQGLAVTFDWHLAAPAAEGADFFSKDTSATLAYAIADQIDESTAGCKNPGAQDSCHWFFGEVDKVAALVQQKFIAAESGFAFAFRPLHEMNRDWFWWGHRDSGYADKYKKIYRALVFHLRGLGLHNILYVWSPAESADFAYYPGDDVVDIIGLDVYGQGSGNMISLDQFKTSLTAISNYARDHGKVAVLSETGNQTQIYDQFWTSRVLQPIKDNGIKIGWVMTWINQPKASTAKPYVPVTGVSNQAEIDDFWNFYKDDMTLFQNDFSNIYQTNFRVLGVATQPAGSPSPITPQPTPAPTPIPSPATPVAPADLTVSLDEQSFFQDNKGGNTCVDLVFNNRSNQARDSWQVTVQLNGVALSRDPWNLTVQANGENITLSAGQSWNQQIPANTYTHIGGFCYVSPGGQKPQIVATSAH